MAHEVGRIESELILRDMKDSETEITLQYITRRFAVRVVFIDGKNLIVQRISSIQESLLVGRIVQLFFMYRNTNMTMTPRVARDEGTTIKLRNETPAYRNISRTFERIFNTSNISISIYTSSPAVEIQYPHTQRPYAHDVHVQRAASLPNDVHKVIDAFRTVMRSNKYDSKIVMFRTNAPQYTVEKVCAFIGKVVIAPTPQELSNNTAIANDSEIAKAIQKIARSERHSQLTDAHHIPDFKDRLFQAFTPILHKQYCVGYLLFASTSSQQKITTQIIDSATQFASALMIALDVNGYFDDIDISQLSGVKVRLIDISANGLRFQYDSEQQIFQKDALLKIVIKIDDEQFPSNFQVEAMVVHISSTSKLHTVAVRYLTLDPVILTKLIDYLHKKH